MREINVGQEMLNIPMGEMVKSLALAIADGQWALDKASMTVAEMMSGQRMLRDLDSGKLIGPNNDYLPDDTKEPIMIDSRVYFGYAYDYEQDSNKIKRVPQKVSMLELGFVPQFYQFIDTIVEVKISVTMTGTTEEAKSESTKTNTNTNSSQHSGSWSWWYWGGYRGQSKYQTEAKVSSVDAKYSAKYSYSIEGASLIRTKLVPVPPPGILEDRIRLVMEDGEIWRDWLLNGAIGVDGTVNKRPGAVDATGDYVVGTRIKLKPPIPEEVKPGWTVGLPSGATHTLVNVANGNVLILDSPVSKEDTMTAGNKPITLNPAPLKRPLPPGPESEEAGEGGT